MFGGWRGDAGLLNDTWEWDGTAWTPESSASTAPSPREDAANRGMAYDEGRREVVLFGGATANASVNGETWVYRQSAVPPPAPQIGGRIVFVRALGATTNLWVMDLETGGVRPITHFPDGTGLTDVASPRWSRDGRRIAFRAVVPGQGPRIHLVNADDDTAPVQVTFMNDGLYADFPVWHPSDPSTIFYKRVVPASTSEIHKLDILTGMDTPVPNAWGQNTQYST